MLLELGRLCVSVVSVPFSVGEDGYKDGRLVRSSDSHDSLQRSKQTNMGKDIEHTQNEKEEESLRVSIYLSQE